MKKYKVTALIVAVAFLAASLSVAVVVVALLYNNLVKYPTPEVSYANAKNAAVKECEQSSLVVSDLCANIRLVSMTEIDVGNDITGTDYVFESPTLSNGVSYGVWVQYDGDILMASTITSN